MLSCSALWLLALLALAAVPPVAATVRVAVVGAGIGGASFTHFLRAELGPPAAGDDAQWEIVVFEKSDRPGGRLTSVRAHRDGTVVEMGASMAIAQNKYVGRLAEEVGLKKVFATDMLPQRGSGKLAILTGQAKGMPSDPSNRQLGFLESDWSAATVFNMMLRYGPISLFKLRQRGQALIDSFDTIYGLQDSGRAFKTPDDLMDAAGLLGPARRSCRAGLLDMLSLLPTSASASTAAPGKGKAASASASAAGVDSSNVGPPGKGKGKDIEAGGGGGGGGDANLKMDDDSKDPLIITELVQGLMRNNYGQDYQNANELVCMTAVAPLAAGGSAAAWSVEGGNEQLPARLLERSGSVVRMNATVTFVGEGQTRAYRVGYRQNSSTGSAGGGGVGGEDGSSSGGSSGSIKVEAAPSPSQSTDEEFDFVIIATPLEASRIDLSQLVDDEQQWVQQEGTQSRMKYQHVYTTLVYGSLRPSFFGMPPHMAQTLNSVTDILTTPLSRSPFNSAGNYGYNASSPDKDEALWKFFSSKPLGGSQLHEFMEYYDKNSVQTQSWKDPGAYPNYATVALEAGPDRPSFVIHEASAGVVLFPSALEVGTSAMEVMAVSARNAALMVKAKQANPDL